MISADLPEPLADRGMGELGPVTIAAQVPEIQMPQFIRDDLLSDFGGSDVGEMAVPAEDALFDGPRSSGVFLQQFQIVVCFQHQDVRGTDPLDNQFRRMAQVR